LLQQFPNKELFSIKILKLFYYLTVDLTSSTFSNGFSLSVIIRGNLPILTKTLPKSLGIYFIKDSEAIRQSKGFAHFLMSFLSLLNFFNPSTSIQGIPSF
jgi:hypothetical protein